MANYRTRRYLPVALVIIIAIVAIVGLVYVARLLFFSGNSVIPMDDNSRTEFLSTAADRSVRLQVRGNIVADENFRTYQIQIGPSQRRLTLYKGYEMNAFDNTLLYNNTPAYQQFVAALNRARMMNGNELTGEANNTNGICASGSLYEFQILQNNKVQKSLWSTSCGSAQGSLRANTNTLVSLFVSQIPGGQTKINSLWQ
jgi:hypothetical protein